MFFLQGLGFASAISGTLVLANTILGGSGLLGMPAALAKAGAAERSLRGTSCLVFLRVLDLFGA